MQYKIANDGEKHKQIAEELAYGFNGRYGQLYKSKPTMIFDPQGRIRLMTMKNVHQDSVQDATELGDRVELLSKRALAYARSRLKQIKAQNAEEPTGYKLGLKPVGDGFDYLIHPMYKKEWIKQFGEE